ncbi:uridylate kinase [Methanohalophilus levihalophilus]|uniref:UMP kinase n=1 Tax=Methanohalophilus levihalophilus TaxID=1431282 RepID=UPI001AE35C31|nr:UMP kinase [Methanohalophilus levihalophilus]MBP2029997.1 uridylate kinase [Methanohalophilus levihalophilus]
MLIVLSIGGSILAKDLDPERFREYAEVLKKLSQEHKVVIVTGGGVAARRYIDAARQLGANESVCDFVGIDVTRLNAQLLIAALGNSAYPEPPGTYREAELALASGKIVVMGGVIPGQTTDAVSAILAEYLNANLLVIATAVDGVYSEDPNKNPAATKFDTMTPEELISVVMSTEMKAGSKSPVDPLAAKIIQRCGMKTIVLDGGNSENIANVVLQENVKSGPVDGVPIGTHILR